MAAEGSTGSMANGGLGPVSVVVCNYEGQAHLPACFAALAELRGVVGEVLVVDNASTDGGLAWLRAHHPEARVVEMGRNAGPAAARNEGMRRARHRWVLALDNDAVLAPDVLEKLCAAAGAGHGAAIVQPRSVFDGEPERVHYDGGWFHYLGLIRLRNFYAPLNEAEGAGVVEVDCAVSVCLLVDRDAVLGIGGYDEFYFILFEDLDLSWRLRLAGARILSVEDAVVRHRAGTAGVSYRQGPRYPARRVFYHSRNRWHFLAKGFGCGTLLLALPALLLYELVWLVFAVATGGAGAWIRGKWAFARHLPVTLRERRELDALRRQPERRLLVPGPLTITPSAARGARGAILRVVDALVTAWGRLFLRAR